MPAATASSQRWAVFSSGFAIIFVLAAIATFSVISTPLRELHGWSATEISLAYSFYSLGMGVLGIFAGALADRFDPRILMYVGGTAHAAGWLLAGTTSELGIFYVALGLAGAGCGTSYTPALMTTLRWFPKIKGKISGMLLASAAMGPAVLSLVTNALIQAYGVQNALWILGIAYLVVVWVVGWLMRKPAPASVGTGAGAATATGAGNAVGLAADDPDMERTDAHTALRPTDFTWSQMLRTRTFWMLFAVMALTSASGTMMVNSASPIAQYQVGAVGPMSAATFGALIVTISTLSNFTGRLITGAVFDRWGGLHTQLMILVVTMIAMAAMSFAFNAPLFVACIVLLGMAFGGLLVVFPPLTSNTFGVTNSGVNYGIMFMGYTVGAFIGPRLSASLFDEGGAGYSWAFGAAVGLALLASLLVLLLLRLRRD